jgi:hypothetical protein
MDGKRVLRGDRMKMPMAVIGTTRAAVIVAAARSSRRAGSLHASPGVCSPYGMCMESW